MKIRLVRPNNRYKNYELGFKSKRDTKEEIAKLKKLPNTKWWWLKKGKRWLGKVGVRRWALNSGEVVIWIAEKERGKGYGHTALKHAIKKAKGMKKKSLIYMCREDNVASKKIVEKVGGVFVGKDNKRKRLKYKIFL